MWLAVGKIALVTFLVAGCAVLVVTYLIKLRRPGAPRREASGYLASALGYMPPTPKPEWVDWEEDSDEDGADPPGGESPPSRR